MMKMKMRSGVIATLLALAPTVQGDEAPAGARGLDMQVKVLDNTGASRGQEQVAARIASSFSALAGSQGNAVALVNALHNGTPVTLAYTVMTMKAGKPVTSSMSSTLAIPTQPMGWGHVRIALALVQAGLQQVSISKPSAQQLQAALTGGSVSGPHGPVEMRGVLALRASGMDWARVAQVHGIKLGPVIASLRQAQSGVAALPVKEEDVDDPKTSAANSTSPRTASVAPSGRE
jgi:hypothetical protein